MVGITNDSGVPGNNRNDLDVLVWNTVNPTPIISTSAALVGGVMQVSVHWTDTTVNIQGDFYRLPAGSVLLNAADVALPATYEVYAWDTNGTTGVLVVASTVNPETDPAVNYRYARLATVRMQSVGGVETIFFCKRSFVAVDLMLHHIGEHDEFLTPTWFEGGALTVTAANGNLSTTALEYTRLRFEAFIDAIANGAILLDNEALNVANVEAITTYADGSAITAGKYHRLLLGVIVGTDDRDFPFIIVRQSKPAVEYATLAAAENDSERKAASSFPAMYQGAVLPLYYINMLLGDASDLSLVDLRPTGIIGGGGGGATGVTDHGLLSGLGDDDHLQYLRADGTRTLTGNMAANAGVTVDGVDVGSHTHSGAGVNGVQVTSASVSDFTEAAQDATGAMVANSANVSLTYTDGVPSLVADLITRGELGVVLANGVNNNIAIGTALLIRVTGPVAGFSVDGFAGGYAGRVLYVYNAVAQNMTANNEAGTSAVANRILTLGGAAATNGVGCMEFVYSGVESRWILVSIRA